MRLFISADLDQHLLETLAETSALLRSQIRGRYVSPDNFHVTLAFLGEQSAAICASLEQLLESCAAHTEAPLVRLSSLGSFGPEKNALLWQGFEHSAALESLAKQLRMGLHEQAISFDEKRFLPHVTLMRKAQLVVDELPAPYLSEGYITSISIMRSHLGNSRACYEPLYRAKLTKSGRD